MKTNLIIKLGSVLLPDISLMTYFTFFIFFWRFWSLSTWYWCNWFYNLLLALCQNDLNIFLKCSEVLVRKSLDKNYNLEITWSYTTTTVITSFVCISIPTISFFWAKMFTDPIRIDRLTSVMWATGFAGFATCRACNLKKIYIKN